MNLYDLEVGVVICPNCQAKVSAEYLLNEDGEVDEFQECMNCGDDYIVEAIGSNEIGTVYQTYLMM